MSALTASVRRAALGAATAVLALGLVTGCGADEIAERATEKALEQAAEGSADVDLDTDGDGGIKIETDEGSFSAGQGLPDDFPVDEVPLVEGEVVSGMSMAGQGWTVSMLVDGSIEDVAAEVKSMLESAGYTIEATTEAGGMTIYNATGDPYTVTASIIEDSENLNVSYTVVIPQE